MKLMLDTNVLFDVFCEREGFYADAARLLAVKIFGDGTLWACANSFTDIYYVATRQGMDGTALQSAFANCTQHLNICSLGQEEIVNASARKWSDFEDCLIDECASKVGADFIITRDANGFESASAPALSPTKFFEMLESEYGVVYADIDI